VSEATEIAFTKGVNLLKKLDIPYFLTGGTFLGIKRDGHLIDWDRDIDVDVLAEDLTPDKIEGLKHCEFLYRAGHSTTLQPPHSSLVIDGVRFDLFTLHLKNNKRFRNLVNEDCHWFPARFYEPPFEFIEYKGIKHRVPSHQLEWLEFFYHDWQTPDKSWKWKANAPNICQLKDI
jgi:hypothetical protein